MEICWCCRYFHELQISPAASHKSQPYQGTPSSVPEQKSHTSSAVASRASLCCASPQEPTQPLGQFVPGDWAPQNTEPSAHATPAGDCPSLQVQSRPCREPWNPGELCFTLLLLSAYTSAASSKWSPGHLILLSLHMILSFLETSAGFVMEQVLWAGPRVLSRMILTNWPELQVSLGPSPHVTGLGCTPRVFQLPKPMNYFLVPLAGCCSWEAWKLQATTRSKISMPCP